MKLEPTRFVVQGNAVIAMRFPGTERVLFCDVTKEAAVAAMRQDKTARNRAIRNGEALFFMECWNTSGILKEVESINSEARSRDQQRTESSSCPLVLANHLSKWRRSRCVR